MGHRMLKTRCWISAHVLGLAAASGAAAQAFPDRPITMVVPYTVGGSTDNVARYVAAQLADELTTSIVVENRAGASGLLGANAVARSRPDGYSLLFIGASGYTIVPDMFPKMGVDMDKQFIPVGYTHRQMMVMTVDPKLPVKNLGELVAYAKRFPGKLNFGSPGNGTFPHLVVEVLKRRLDFQATHVPYKGGADVQRAMMGGEVQFAIETVSSALPYITSDKMRAITVMDAKRVDPLPEVPTLVEQGVDLTVYTWSALLAPAGTPPAVIDNLRAALLRVQAKPAVQARFKAIHAEAFQASPQEIRISAQRESALWKPVIEDLGLIEN